jgi:hypothetical protein
MTHDGHLGAFVPADVLRQFLQDSEAMPQLRDVLQLQNEQLGVRARRIEELRTATTEAIAAAEHLKKALLLEDIARANAQDELGRWYRNPVLMIGGGLVVGALAAITVVGLTS